MIATRIGGFKGRLDRFVENCSISGYQLLLPNENTTSLNCWISVLEGNIWGKPWPLFMVSGWLLCETRCSIRWTTGLIQKDASYVLMFIQELTPDCISPSEDVNGVGTYRDILGGYSLAVEFLSLRFFLLPRAGQKAFGRHLSLASLLVARNKTCSYI